MSSGKKSQSLLTSAATVGVIAALAFGLFSPAGCPAQPAPPEWLLNSRGVFSNRLERPLRYQPDHGDFVIENGEEFFNRPLYCRNTAFRVDGGDRPEFSLYVPGRGGNLRLGIQTSAGVKWLHDAKQIVARYRPGALLYDIRDPLLGDGALQLTVLPTSDADGLIARLEWNGSGAPLDLICAFGGANGMRGRRGGDIGCETEPISRFFQLRPDQCRSNEFVIGANGFLLHSRTVDLAGVFSTDAKSFVADANQWNSPAALMASSNSAVAEPVVVTRLRLPKHQEIFLALQRLEAGAGLPPAVPDSQLKKVFEAAEQHRVEVAQRVVVDTPDPFINAAAGALNVAADAIWDRRQQSFMHGAVAWRTRLLGWRGPYAGDALGWHDRTATHFAGFAAQQNTNPVSETLPPADSNANLARNETALHSNGDLTRSHYDMNLVAVDAFFRHLLWTGDLEFARREWPVIERHFAWERRLFRRPFGPDALPLYEAYNCIWASDNMQFNGGGATHSTAYNYFHNRLAARVAALLGKDASPYEREADSIRAAMRQYLWLPERGGFAEWRDYLGRQLAHPNAGLWTVYHTIDSEVPTPFEAWQMTRQVDTEIAHIPICILPRPAKNERGEGWGEGKTKSGASSPRPSPPFHGGEGEELAVVRSLGTNLFTLPSTSWMPYQWSLNNVVMAEAAHTSLAFWQANRPDAAFALFKGCLLDSMFLGACPGNVGMTTHYDMARGEAQRDFGDAIGASSRALIEGLFGVHPDALAGELIIRPGFPADWPRASIRHPDFAFAFERDGSTERFTVEPKFSRPMALRLQVPALRDRVRSVTVNGRPMEWAMAVDRVGSPWIEMHCSAAPKFEVVISWTGAAPVSIATAPERIVPAGEELSVDFGSATPRAVNDPQRALGEFRLERNSLHASTSSAMGHRTVFVRLEQGALTWWEPIVFEIRAPLEILGSQAQQPAQLRFRVRNNRSNPVDEEVTIRAGGHEQLMRLHAPAGGESAETVLSVDRLLLGTIPVVIQFREGRSLTGLVTNWKSMARIESSRMETVDLESRFNDRLGQIFRNRYVSPRSPFCSLAMPSQGVGGWSEFNTQFDVDDSGLRADADAADGKLVVQGVPFATPGAGGAKNILFTSQWDNYPREASVPLNGRASHVYLLMAGSTGPMQSRFDNGEVVVEYADGRTQSLALNNPVNWWPIDQDYFLDDFAFRRTEPIPPRVDLKTGLVRILDAGLKGRGGKIPGGAATVLDLPLDAGKELKSITVRALANEVVIGLMAVTLVR